MPFPGASIVRKGASMTHRIVRTLSFWALVLASLGLVRAQADFSIAISPSSQTVWQAQSTNYLVTITGTGGFSGTVSLSATGLPSVATANFNPATVTGSGTSTMTITAAAGTPTGTSTI